jgi:hypothetical protein
MRNLKVINGHSVSQGREGRLLEAVGNPQITPFPKLA